MHPGRGLADPHAPCARPTAAVRTRALVPLGPTLYVSPAPRSPKRDFMRSVVLRRPYMALPELATDDRRSASFAGTNFHRGTTFYLSERQNV